jgi:aspartate/methionine/tyrosine aminotransferase
MTPPVHPHWIAVTEAIFGYSSIRTIKRTSDGLPDMDDTERVFRSIDRPFVVISTPDENPSGVCTPNSMLFNSEQTGLINRIRNNTKWGILLLDVIYMDVAWGENSGKRHEAIKAVHELGSRALVTHSLSKIFMKPGARIGGVAYVGALDEIGEELLARFKAVVDGNIKNGISAPTLSGLIEAYGGSEAIKAEIFENISQIRGRVEANEKIMNHGSISKAYPDSKIEAGFYGLHAISSDKKLPWRNPEYHQHLVDRIQKKLDFTDLDVRLAWREFRAVVGKKGMSASRAFAIECAMNGLMVLPHDPFWPMFSDNDLNVPFPDLIKDARGENAIIFRTILAYDPEITSRARDMITGVWEGGIRDYEKGVWRDKY